MRQDDAGRGYQHPANARMRSTYECLERGLGCNGLMYRFGDAEGERPSEGAFGLCGFWAVDYLAQLGEEQQAAERFERLLSFANDLGLYGEEIDPESGQALGDFPQSYTHIGLIAAAVSLQQCAGRPRAAA